MYICICIIYICIIYICIIYTSGGTQFMLLESLTKHPSWSTADHISKSILCGTVNNSTGVRHSSMLGFWGEKGLQKKKPNMFTAGSSASATFVLPVYIYICIMYIYICIMYIRQKGGRTKCVPTTTLQHKQNQPSTRSFVRLSHRVGSVPSHPLTLVVVRVRGKYLPLPMTTTST